MKQISFKSIKIQNFKCHENMEMDFENGKSYLITGPNGSGKTSLVIDTICWALYNETSQGKRADDVIRKKSGKNCFVEVVLNVNNDIYKIENYRKHYKHNNNKFLYLNGENISGANVDETNKKIESAIIPKDVFLNSLLFSQHVGGGGFLALKPTDQKGVLDQILQFDKYDEYKKIVDDEISETLALKTNQENKLNNIKMKISTNRENMETYKSKINELEKILETEIFKIKFDNKNLLKLIDEISYNKNMHEKLMSDYNLCRDEIRKIEFSISELNDKRHNEISIKSNQLKTENLNKSTEINNKYNEVLSNLKQKKSEYESKLNTYSMDVENKKQGLINSYHKEKDKETKEINDKISELELEIKKNRLEFENCENTVKTLEQNAKKLLNKANDLKNSENKTCPTCGQTITQSDDYRNHIEKECKKIKEEVDEIMKTSNEYSVKLSNLKTNNSKIIKESAELLEKSETLKSRIQEKYKKMNSELKETYLKEKSKIDSEISELTILIDESTKSNKKEIDFINHLLKTQLEDVESEISEKYTNEKTKLTKQLEVKKFEENSLSKDLNTIEKNLEKINEYENLIKTNKALIESKTNQTKSYKNNILKDIENLIESEESMKTSIEEINREISKIENNIKILEFWKIAFGNTGIKAILLDEAIPIMNKKAMEITKQLNNLRIRFDSQKAIKSGDLRNKFSVNVIQTKNLSEYGELSAGETRIVNIVVLLCIRQLLETVNGTVVNLMLFDEIFDSLDDSNSTIISEILREYVGKDKCVIIISHKHKESINADKVFNL